MIKQKRAEAKLLADLKKAKPKAVKKWFDLYYPKLIKIALKKAQTNKDAEELVQETFINCLKSLPLFKGDSSLLTWMQSILRHEIADYYRKKYAKKAIRTLPLGDFLLSEPVDNAEQLSIKVKTVLSKMVEEKRELLCMKYIDKKKVKEIAKQFGRTAKAIESDLFRARREFRELFLQLDEV